MRASEDITLHPHLGKNREGVESWGDAVVLKQAAIPWPRTSNDLDEGGTIIGENVFLPGDVGASIKSADQVTLRGQRYAIDGKPGDLRKGGRRKGILLNLKAVQ
jgi:hypothetical protein